MRAANFICLVFAVLVAVFVYPWPSGQPEITHYVGAGAWGFIAFTVFRELWAAREGIAHDLKNVVLAVVLGLVVYGAIPLAENPTVLEQREALAFLAAAIALWLAPRRSRSIPSDVRPAVIRRDLRGRRFDPSRHHIDHIWPFSRGGSHTEDNLRVVNKRKNLRKGARKPKPWDWFSR